MTMAGWCLTALPAQIAHTRAMSVQNIYYVGPGGNNLRTMDRRPQRSLSSQSIGKYRQLKQNN